MSESDSKNPDLPSWIFDIDDEDEVRLDTPLLKELDIDLQHIYRNIEWMMLGPWKYILGYPMSRHPLHKTVSSTKSEQTIDFWGPCSIFSLYGAIVWIARVKDVPWLYVIWTVSAIFNHLVCRVWLSSSKLLMHMALLGYSTTPMIPFALAIAILRPSIWLAYVLEMLAVTWASSSAILSYYIICTGPADKKGRLLLIIPSVILMELYLISLMPIKR